MKTKHVSVQLQSQSEPMEFVGVANTYTKGPFFCVWMYDGTVYKFPVALIFKIREWRD